MFTKRNHHRNLSVILIAQNIFKQGRHCRDISLNAKYLVLLKKSTNTDRFLYLARKAYPVNADNLYKAYLEATDRLHSYFILDFAQDTSLLVRFRTGVFPDEQTTIYAFDETYKVQLSRTSGTQKGQPEIKKTIIIN
jgi:hypothetical protein